MSIIQLISDKQTTIMRFRDYQTEADSTIAHELDRSNACVVKMFCGTGKSNLMFNGKFTKNKPIRVYVFYSLALICQFAHDYCSNIKRKLIISSDVPVDDTPTTTDPAVIRKYLDLNAAKSLVLVTYQSFHLLLDHFNANNKISLCCFDEAHHIVGDHMIPLLFTTTDDSNKITLRTDKICKQVFFTATPVNSNGILMHDREDATNIGMCGPIVYDYSYLRGTCEGHLNAFEIRLDFYLEESIMSIYDSIARTILTTGNSRVLTFHSDVTTGRDTSVNNFANEPLFCAAFNRVAINEFPERVNYYKSIKMVALSAENTSMERKYILMNLDTCLDTDVYVICSCETIGEGIDTKMANMCVFVDPKSSYVKIIQNIGRIVRRIEGSNRPNSTILLPCYVDKTKYADVGDDAEKRNAIICEDMGKTGNFNAIQNVMAALKHEDSDLPDIWLLYQNKYSHREITLNLHKQGYFINEDKGEESLRDVIEDLLPNNDDNSSDNDSCSYDDNDDNSGYSCDDDYLQQVSAKYKVGIELHTQELNGQIKRYGTTNEKEIIRVYQSDDNVENEEDNCVYYPIEPIDKQPKNGKCTEPNKNKRFSMKVHHTDELKVLWKLCGEVDLLQNISSCVIDCEVVKYDSMEIAQKIINRANKRELLGQDKLPRHIRNKNRTTAELEQETKDAQKLSHWKMALKGKGKSKCPPESVVVLLDKELSGWRDELDLEANALRSAKKIIERSQGRELLGQNKLPRKIQNKKNRTTAELELEHKDANKLNNWKNALKGKGTSKCPDSVIKLLDKELSGWRDELDLEANALRSANEIIERSQERELLGQNKLPRKIKNKKNRTTAELEQEYKDANKLGKWKNALKGKGNGSKCPESVVALLDKELSGWRDELDLEANALRSAKKIIERSQERELLGQNKLPKQIANEKNRATAELEQEYKDACKLNDWRMALKGKGTSKCPESVVVLLDNSLSGWRDELDLEANALQLANEIIERSQGRELLGQNKLPRYIDKKNRTTTELEQEQKDAVKLGDWKMALKGKGSGSKCPESVVVLLDKELSGWRDELDLEANALRSAKKIIERSRDRELLGQNKLPIKIKNKNNRTTAELEQEYKDACKLGDCKQALKGKGTSKCFESVVELLDKELSGWRDDNFSKNNKRKSTELSNVINSNNTNIDHLKKRRELPPISSLHQKYKTMTSDNLNKLFNENNGQLWHEYHEIAEANDQTFNAEDLPRNKIIAELDKMQSTQNVHVADMGCGKAHISAHFENNQMVSVNSFDHFSDNERVVQCDIKQVPLVSYSMDVAILSLALWGSNCREYIEEANRILKTHGTLYVAEATRRWSTMDDNNVYIGEPGIKLLELLQMNGFVVIEKQVDKFCVCKCIKL